MSNTGQLYLFCISANHGKCETWLEHRVKLDKDKEFIERLLLSIPDAVATGKSVQKAAREGQGALEPYPHPALPQQISFPRVNDPEPKSVYFVQSGDGDEDWWTTFDTLVSGKMERFYYREDARSAAILAYKPRRVQIFFDGEPDEWNEWR